MPQSGSKGSACARPNWPQTASSPCHTHHRPSGPHERPANAPRPSLTAKSLPPDARRHFRRRSRCGQCQIPPLHDRPATVPPPRNRQHRRARDVPGPAGIQPTRSHNRLPRSGRASGGPDARVAPMSNRRRECVKTHQSPGLGGVAPAPVQGRPVRREWQYPPPFQPADGKERTQALRPAPGATVRPALRARQAFRPVWPTDRRQKRRFQG